MFTESVMVMPTTMAKRRFVSSVYLACFLVSAGLFRLVCYDITGYDDDYDELWRL